ncbi:MAG: hypothetical protein CMP53_00485 [Flavobacteriales bacterium]|nr:hypothetical protein [Flavobacteriales bacterium]|tara:strand:+ start:3715 stop:4443 length:729 start_codon:yes stop_codon:yes gene_type:complete
MIYVALGLGLLFVVIGYIITERNADMLLNGYNTMSKEEKAQFPLKEYLVVFKQFHLRFGILFALSGVALAIINPDYVGYHAGITPILAYIYFFIQTKKFSQHLPSQTKGLKLGLAVLIAALVFVIGMFYWSDRPSLVKLNDHTLKISGPYGIDLPLEKIDSLGILLTLPEINARRHGFSTGSVAKGRYKGPVGDYLLLIDKPFDKVLWIGRKSGDPVLIALQELDEEKLLLELKESLELNSP